ncbi:catalase [Phaeodactylum tricornutum CCAP 1055/1]|jgi:catalase|uniref:Catalase n=2 Tax=Phaeodactylum tricornutum TaxID=2850 RepID=B7G713_PHATC|nr:catalase [Phaeodactylum tricornutum CCAP 1055/1]EEC45690.1 catalase [Phaeodactylum tricornutum CCAP 1055/1]|eukprot:XP_002182954.1 catalase [Phaeodactylum tricornutum CCAP 1055/1]
MSDQTSSRDAASNQLDAYASQRYVVSPAIELLKASNGAPVDSLTASMTAGPRGPIVLQDFTLLDHMARFDRERIPERVVHAKGAGAFGVFQVTSPEPIRSVCKAQVFQSMEPTPVAVRFSTVGGETGSADTARDPRGFAVKFYTTEGNWDLVGNNTPIFFIRDPMLFPSFIHTQKRNPATHLADPDAFWDFIGLRPETTHQVTFLFSDRGTPDGYRHMNGYGSHTFKNVNSNGEAVYVKYHWKTDQGVANLDAEHAARLAASDPDYATRDLYNAIATGNYPSWTLYVQIMTYAEAAAVDINPFDLTKVWPHSRFPLHEVGRMTLNRNPKDYFAEVEQLAFAPSHLVPGIEPSPDKMLQARLFSYPDTHRHRLGTNYQAIPVNAPRNISAAQQHNYQRDGPMQVTENGAGAPNYFPNSFGGVQPPPATAHGPELAWHADTVSGQVVRIDTGDEDNVSQCRDFYRNVLDQAARARLTDNLAAHLCRAQPFLRARAIHNFTQVDSTFGAQLKAAVAQKVMHTPPPSQSRRRPAKLNPPRIVPPPTASRGLCPAGYGNQGSPAHGYASKL